MASEKNVVCGYEIKFDYSTNTPLHYLTLILKYAVPKDFIWDQNLMKMLECDSKSALVPGQMNEAKSNIIFAGSSSEGLTVPMYTHWSKGKNVLSDFDKLFIQCNTFSFNLPFEYRHLSSGQILRIGSAEDAPPNYDYLVPTEEFKRAREIQGNPVQTKYFSNMILKQERLDMWRNPFKHFNINPGPLTPSVQPTGEFSFHGPALTMESVVDSDEVPVFYFPGWPHVASEWPTRNRPSGWPTRRMVNKIVVGGFYMAGVGRKGSPMCEYEWRYSFNNADKVLAHSLTRHQRQVYIYMKLLRKFYLYQPSLFPSYWLKVTFFWICERISSERFRSERLGELMLYIIDEIIHSVSIKLLPNYFIPSVNMMSMVPPDHCTTLLKNLRYVRSHIIECVVRIDEEIDFVSLLKKPNEKLSRLFASVLSQRKACPFDGEAFRTSALTNLKGVLKYYLEKFKQLDRLDIEEADRERLRNNLIDLIREVTDDLRRFDNSLANVSRNTEDNNLQLVLEQIREPHYIAKVMILLHLVGERSRLSDVKRKMCDAVQNRLEGAKRAGNVSDTERTTLEEIQKCITAINDGNLQQLDNEILYKQHFVNLKFSGPAVGKAQELCKQM